VQKQIKLEEFTRPGWEDAANFLHQRDEKYRTSELRLPADVKRQTDDDGVAPAPITIGVLLVCVDSVPRISRMYQQTSRPGSCHIRLGCWKPQSNTSIASVVHPTMPV